MSKRYAAWVGLCLLVIFGVAGLFLLKEKPESPWEPTTVAYDPECKTGCEELSATSLTHLGDVSVYVQTQVDDPIAQWGDCLDSVTQCIEKKDFTTTHLATCVRASLCPQECKDAFSTEARGAKQFDGALDAFERVFMNDNAVCLPKEEHR